MWCVSNLGIWNCVGFCYRLLEYICWQVTFRNITKFEWDHQYYQGNLISVTDKFMAYSLKGMLVNISASLLASLMYEVLNQVFNR